jgi:hypothetical protein
MISMYSFVFSAREIARDFTAFAREHSAEQAEVPAA